MSRRLAPSPEDLHARWEPPGARKSTPSPAIPAEIRRDKRQFSLWESSPADDDAAVEASTQPETD
jgi:hypothetical protein